LIRVWMNLFLSRGGFETRPYQVCMKDRELIPQPFCLDSMRRRIAEMCYDLLFRQPLRACLKTQNQDANKDPDRHSGVLLAGIHALSKPLDPDQKHAGVTLGVTFWTRS
jgi:hypothetical protein